MKNNKIKTIARLLICMVASFAVIYLLVFLGGWKLIESGDPILIEIAVAVIVGMLVYLIYELSTHYDGELKKMKERIAELEKKIGESGEK